MDIGSGELLVIAIVLLVVLVPTKVPQLARSIGEAMSELRKARDEPNDTKPADATPVEVKPVEIQPAQLEQADG